MYDNVNVKSQLKIKMSCNLFNFPYFYIKSQIRPFDPKHAA